MTLLHRIELFLRRSGETPTAFGQAAMNDPAFVRDLRRGRQPRPNTEERVRAFLASAERERGKA